MVSLRYIMLCLALNVFCISDIKAQFGSQKIPEFRGDVFFGLGPALTEPGLTINFTSEVQSKFGLLQFRLNGIREGLKILPEKEPLESSVDVSLLYGMRFFLDDPNMESKLSLSVLAGIGETTQIKRGNQISVGNTFAPNKYEKIENREIGLSYEISLASRENQLSAKIALVGNFNKSQSYTGIIGGFILKIF